MTDLEKLIGLARITRTVFERVAKKQKGSPNLVGYCYDASCFLRKLAEKHAIKTDLGIGNGHWFVLYGDIIIDVTATQFGIEEKIAILPLTEAKTRGSWWWNIRYRDSYYPSCFYDKEAEKEMEELNEESIEADL